LLIFGILISVVDVAGTVEVLSLRNRLRRGVDLVVAEPRRKAVDVDQDFLVARRDLLQPAAENEKRRRGDDGQYAE
jgi:hypothetical protein